MKRLPSLSPGLTQLRKWFWVGLKTEGLISKWRGGGYKRDNNSKKRSEMRHSNEQACSSASAKRVSAWPDRGLIIEIFLITLSLILFKMWG